MEILKLVIHWTFRILLGGFFILAGVLKSLDPGAFQIEILAYQIVGYPISFLAAYYLPFIEIMLGISVVFAFRIRWGLIAIMILLSVFIVALTWTWIRGIDLQCGCLGKIDFLEGQPAAIMRDIVLIGMAWVLFYPHSSHAKSSQA